MKREITGVRFVIMAWISVVLQLTASGPVFARQAEGIDSIARQYRQSSGLAGWQLAQSSELQGKICQASIQDQIEWDYEGNRHWQKQNLEKICENAKYSLQPGVCFKRVMHGNISYGSGTRWHWRPALELCAGTQDANATVECFTAAISRQIPWRQAIEQCRTNPP